MPENSVASARVPVLTVHSLPLGVIKLRNIGNGWALIGREVFATIEQPDKAALHRTANILSILRITLAEKVT